MKRSGEEPTSRATSVAGRVMFVVGVVLQVIIAYPLAALGLVAPVWAVVGLLAVWAIVLVVVIWQYNTRPWLALAAPFATVAIALAVVAAGGAFLGWQA
jgi:hypothetical protein